jgi:hypothetical protein
LWNNFTNVTEVNSIYLGGRRASNYSGVAGGIDFTAPVGSGAADFYAFTGDGGMQVIPEAFSYGPQILQVVTNYSAREGGGTGVVTGYGFGPFFGTTVPADLGVRVGGVQSTIVSYDSNLYGTFAPPLPLEGFAFTIPAGASAADVTVSNSTGVARAPAAISYLPAIQQFALPGATLAQGIYDPHRDVYYFTDAAVIRVFSRSKSQWLASIPITPPAGSLQRLWGIALSPDGSKLAVSDVAAGTIYVLNPDAPSPAKTFTPPQTGTLEVPTGLAINDAGVVYFAAATPNVTEGWGIFKLDTNTGTFLNYQQYNAGSDDQYLRVALSADGARAYFNVKGVVFAIDTATDRLYYASVGPGGSYGDDELSLSSNQTSFSATGYFFDSDLDAQASIGLNDREYLTASSYVYGAKLSPDGSVLFQPTTSGMDVIDGKRGNLFARVALPFQLSPGYDALVSDGIDNVLVAITGATGAGIAILDFTTIGEPQPVPYASSLKQELHGLAVTPKSAAPKSGKQAATAGTRLRPKITHITNATLLPSTMRAPAKADVSGPR